MDFFAVRDRLADQYTNIQWLPGSGLNKEQLTQVADNMEKQYPSGMQIRANLFAYIAENAQLAIDKDDIYQDKLDGTNVIKRLRIRWEKALKEAKFPDYVAELALAKDQYGTYHANSDYSHTSPNTRLLMELGFAGLRQRVSEKAKGADLTPQQREFYECCDVMLTAMNTVARRFAEAVAPYNEDNARALLSISRGAPQSTYEALQLLILYFHMHDNIFGTRIRTLGRLDVLLTPFCEEDLKRGITKETLAQQLRFFLHKFWAAKIPYDLPFCLCGMDEKGEDVTNWVTELILDTYNELNIYSPKIHIRMNAKTPASTVQKVLSFIRGGNSSFVFVNDPTAMKGLVSVGIQEKDAWDYVPIGCYEPAVWGMELGCTGCGGVNLPKAVELVLTGGRDARTGDLCGAETGKVTDFEGFKAAVKTQIAYLTDRATGYVAGIEPYYGVVNADPLLSCQYEACLDSGVDIYWGGAKYNNSSLAFYCIGSLADSLLAVQKLVFEEKLLTLEQLTEVLKNNWEGHEGLRQHALSLAKYGNNDPAADALAAELAHYCAGLVNNKPNGRGGVFKASLYTIDHCFRLGRLTMATPDGRLAGQPLSKNMCAAVGMDRKGITGMIHSAGRIDASRFPNGSVLDVVLHPSAVAGDEGLMAFYGLLLTYFKLGGLALHGNVFNAEDLKKAQKDPEQYKNLQVRVCGWNAYFVNLTKDEQDAFILQAENAL